MKLQSCQNSIVYVADPEGDKPYIVSCPSIITIVALLSISDGPSEARLTHLAYATEIAGAMLQRQQASAILSARQIIVEGAVGMVEMLLSASSKEPRLNLLVKRRLCSSTTKSRRVDTVIN